MDYGGERLHVIGIDLSSAVCELRRPSHLKYRVIPAIGWSRFDTNSGIELRGALLALTLVCFYRLYTYWRQRCQDSAVREMIAVPHDYAPSWLENPGVPLALRQLSSQFTHQRHDKPLRDLKPPLPPLRASPGQAQRRPREPRAPTRYKQQIGRRCVG